MDHHELTAELGAVISTFEEARLALLFGSRARGTARPGSDVDLAVIGGPLDLSDLARAASDAVGLEVDVVDIRNAGEEDLRRFAEHVGAWLLEQGRKH